MENAGCGLLVEPEEETVMGFSRVLRKLPFFVSLLARVAQTLDKHRPDRVILVDYPGLNLRIAKIAGKLGIPVIYFICPQLWAWAPWRIGKFSKFVDLALTIFPFEKEFYSSHGIDARYIGHPACDRSEDDLIEGSANEHELPQGRDILGLMPGSRKQEILMNLPVMLKAASRLKASLPRILPVVSHYDTSLLNIARNMADDLGQEIDVMHGGMRRLARSSRLCMVGSGTATIEVAFSKTPMIVIYRTSKLACRLAPILLTVPHICQVNLLAGEELVPEFLVHNDDPAPLCSKALPLLEEGETRDRMLSRLAAFHERFFRPGALKNAATTILNPAGS